MSPAPTFENAKSPTATTAGPTVIGARGPMRWLSAPIVGDSRSEAIVTGSIAAPASSAE